jgi:hypothetical protein
MRKHNNILQNCSKHDIRIYFTTRDNLHLLQNNHNNKVRNLYNKSGVYQLKCTECEKRYVGQTEKPFHLRFKEHSRVYK